jgi:hypothetical protein
MESKLGRAGHRLESGWNPQGSEFRILCSPQDPASSGRGTAPKVVRVHSWIEVWACVGRHKPRPLMEGKFARGEHGFEYRWDRKV